MVIAYAVTLSEESDEPFYAAKVAEPDVDEFNSDEWMTEDEVRAAFVAGNLVFNLSSDSSITYERAMEMVADSEGIIVSSRNVDVNVMPSDGFPPITPG